MKTTIDVTIIDTPSNQVRGMVTAFALINGKNKRVAHAVLLTDRPAELTIEVPKRLSLDEVRTVSNVLDQFVAKVVENGG